MFSINLSETFSVLRRIERDVLKMHIVFLREVPVNL